MEQRQLAGTDLAVGRVVFGAMTFGDQVDESAAREMVDIAREAGVSMFDTSNNYAGGRSEEILGRAIQPFRSEVLVSTKGGSPVGQDADQLSGLSRGALRSAVEASLGRLGVECIDVYYLHRPDRSTPVEETLEVLSELVDQGKIGQIAQSNYAAWQVADMVHVARRDGLPQPLVAQAQYSLLSRRVEAEYAEFSQQFGVTNIAYNVLAGGLLTGKHRFDSDPARATRFTKEMYRSRYWNEAQFAAVDELRTTAAAAGLTLIELALRWVMSTSFADLMLIGASSVDQLRANLHALDGPKLDRATMDACDLVWQSLAGSAPNYNR